MTTAIPKPPCDPAAIVDALRAILAPGQVTELRALDAVFQGERWPTTMSGYFDEPKKLAEAAAKIKSAKGVYFIPNPVKPALLARAANRAKKAGKGEATQDHDIVARRYLLIDLDAIRPTGISSSDPEHDAAIDRARAVYRYLRGEGWPDPIAADSGNGGHLLYRVDLPTDDGGLVQRCLTALAQRFDDESVHVDQAVYNPARIWKLPGTLACKGDDTPERPHRMARVLSVPAELAIVPAHLLEQLAAEAVVTADPEPTRTPAEGNGEAFDLESFIARHGLAVDGPEPWNGKQGPGQRWVFRQSPMCEHHDGAGYLIQHNSGAITAGCHHNSCSWGWADLRQRYAPVAQPVRPKMNSTKPARVHASTVLAWRPFPVEVLPEPARSFVVCGAKAMVCEPAYIALPLLAMLATAIGTTRRVRLKGGWCEPSVLWTAIVADSGTLKSPAANYALDALNRVQAWKLEEYPKLREQYERDKLLYEADLANWKRKGRAKGEPPPEKPDEPTVQRYIVHDITIEALAERLASAPRGLLSANDELGAWLGSFDQYRPSGGADVPRWLSIYRAESLIIDRKTGPVKTIFVKRAAVCVTGSITPVALARALGQEHLENGLAARIGLAMPPRVRKRWTEATVDQGVIRPVERLVGRLLALDFGTDANDSPAPIDLNLTPEGKAEWIGFYDEHNEKQEALMGPLASAYAKLEGGAARLALVVQLVRWAADAAEGGAIDGDSMRAGIALARWFRYEAERVYAALAENREGRDRRRLVEWIERKGGRVSVRDLQQGRRDIATAEAAEAALNDLATAGLGSWEAIPTTPHGGRPSRVFQLTANVYVYETPEKPDGNGGSVDVDNDVGTETASDTCSSNAQGATDESDDWGAI